ncbi:MAG TPA: VOC family protein [Mariniphaga sp.]|nr:VOC family protein [Mariniphaga sp.]
MSKIITGLHHVTAMTSDAQANLNFYAGILGLRLVKRTINFDAPDVYHFYYGDETGSPGSIMTFFPIPGLKRGRKGNGQLTVTSFSIPESSLEYWMKRLDKFNVSYRPPQQRFEEVFIYFEDYEGQGLELVANAKDLRKGYGTGHIPAEHAIRGFYGVTLSIESYERTAGLLTSIMDHHSIEEKGSRFRFSASGKPGDLVDIVCVPDAQRGLSGSGTVHHLAFATESDDTQLEISKKLQAYGLDVTRILDRQYFHSIYFREPSGILFEVATSDIGFEIDEEREKLGEALKLPQWQEKNRASIEEDLPSIDINFETYYD